MNIINGLGNSFYNHQPIKNENDTESFSKIYEAQKAKKADADTKQLLNEETKNLLFGNMSECVKNAWEKAENESDYNPLVNKEGKIVNSSLLARHMETEYNLMLRYGEKEARNMMLNIFSDKELAKGLVQSALERANNPLHNNISKEQSDKEKEFFELFLSYIDA